MSLNYRDTEHAVRNIISLYVSKGQMFTVYQIWSDAQEFVKDILDYDTVRQVVESIINDGGSQIPRWTRSLGNHLRKLDNSTGRVGQAPQIYHPVGADIRNYDPNFRFKQVQSVTVVTHNRTGLVVASPLPKQKANRKGFCKFKVWANGSLVDCSLTNPRGNGGKFLPNVDGESHGVLDNGQPVLVRQDNEGKLYATSVN